MRDARRIMRMVAELHRLGYEQLRLAPAMSPSGMHWRGSVTSASNITKAHGAMIRAYDEELVAFHSTGDGLRAFGWEDAEADTAEQLAQKFIERFPAIAGAGKGSDPDYFAWYSEMLAVTAPDGFIYAFADWDVPTDRMPAMGVPDSVIIPLPPPGDADD